jgi:hypothetical protein
MKELERLTDVYAKTGQLSVADASAMRYFRIEAEVWIIEAGGKVPEWKGPPRKGQGGEELTPPVERSRGPKKKDPTGNALKGKSTVVEPLGEPVEDVTLRKKPAEKK